MKEREKTILSRSQLIVAVVTLLAAVYAIYYARGAYDVALQQIKDKGSWLQISMVDFQYIRQGGGSCFGQSMIHNRKDSFGCFWIKVSNRLNVDAVNIDLDYKVDQNNWLSDWRVKEGIQVVSKGFSLDGGSPPASVIFRGAIAADPLGHYCDRRNDLNLRVQAKWRDVKKLSYELTRKFRGYCLKTKTGKLKFRWISLN